MSFFKKLFGGAGSATTGVSPAPTPKASAPSAPKASSDGPKDTVEQVKDLIRRASGARDFISRVNQAGFSKIKQDFIGIYLQKGDCTLIVAVLPSHGEDSIWCLSMTTKGAGIVNLIDEGRLTF